MNMEKISYCFKDFRDDMWKTETSEHKRIIAEQILEERGFKLYSNCIGLDVVKGETATAESYYIETIELINTLLKSIDKTDYKLDIIKSPKGL